MKTKEILAIIPARGYSKGLPNKNILFLGDKPLIAHTIGKAMSSNKISRVIVSTEDSKIAEIAKKFGAEIPFMRPLELAQDDSPIYDVVLDTLKKLKEKENYEPDILVFLQSVSPFVTTKQIDSAIQKLIETDADVVYSICEFPYPLLWMQTLDGDKPKMIFNNVKIKRRQDAPKSYKPTGAFYIVKTKTFLNRKDNLPMFVPKIGEDTRTIVTDEITATDIDTKIDFLWTTFLLNSHFKINGTNNGKNNFN